MDVSTDECSVYEEKFNDGFFLMSYAAHRQLWIFPCLKEVYFGLYEEQLGQKYVTDIQ